MRSRHGFDARINLEVIHQLRSIIVKYAGLAAHPVPPPLQIEVHQELAAFVQQLAQSTEWFVSVHRPYCVVPLPGEVLQVGSVVVVEVMEVGGEVLRRVEISDIDEGMRRENLGVVGASHYYRYYAVVQCPERLLGHVIPTDGVLEGQIELVLALVHYHAGVALAARTAQIAAVSVHVDRDVPGQVCGVLVSNATLLVASGYHPRYRVFVRLLPDVGHRDRDITAAVRPPLDDRIRKRDRRIPTIRHCDVEDVIQPMVVAQLRDRSFPVEIDVHLFRISSWRYHGLGLPIQKPATDDHGVCRPEFVMITRS